MTFDIAKIHLEKFTESLKELNEKKVIKHGPAIEITNVEEYTSKTDEDRPRNYQRLILTLESPAISVEGKVGIAGAQFIGTIKIEQGVKTVFSTSDKYVLSDMPLRCDHCGYDRKRSSYFVFELEGKVLMIGRSCVKEYFGIDITRYLTSLMNVFDLIESGISDADEFCRGHHAKRYWTIEELIVATRLTTKEWKYYLSSAKAQELERSGTSSSVAGRLHDVFYPSEYSSEEDRELFFAAYDDMKANGEFDVIKSKLIEKFGNMVPENDFQNNVKNNLFYEDGTVRDFIVSAGVVIYALFSTMHVQVEKTADVRVSEFIGEDGDKITVKVQLRSNIQLESMYGVSYLMIFADENGNMFKTFTTGTVANRDPSEEWITLKGTVKGHDEYKGKKYTQITRVKEVA